MGSPERHTTTGDRLTALANLATFVTFGGWTYERSMSRSGSHMASFGCQVARLRVSTPLPRLGRNAHSAAAFARELNRGVSHWRSEQAWRRWDLTAPQQTSAQDFGVIRICVVRATQSGYGVAEQKFRVREDLVSFQ